MQANESSTISFDTLHVTELARRTGVTPATIRHYVRRELLHPSREQNNGYRCFSTRDIKRVLFVRKAQRLGLTIRDIKSILLSVDRGDTPCEQVKTLVLNRLSIIRKRIEDLRQTELTIVQSLEIWEHLDVSKNTSADELCPLIEKCPAELSLTTNSDPLCPAAIEDDVSHSSAA